jgi:uridine kinase
LSAGRIRAVTPRRRALLDRLTTAIDALPSHRPQKVAIDGVDGAGKTMLADELATGLATAGRPTLRASVDGFHRPRAQRYARGRRSPEGYYLDAYDYPALRSVLLDPFAAGGQACPAVWDHVRDAPVPRRWLPVETSTVLLLDGIFLHRPELRSQWDLSIFCRVRPDVSCARMAARDGTPADPRHPDNRRYVEGQRLYLDADDPEAYATYVLDNTDVEAPSLVRP